MSYIVIPHRSTDPPPMISHGGGADVRGARPAKEQRLQMLKLFMQRYLHGKMLSCDMGCPMGPDLVLQVEGL